MAFSIEFLLLSTVSLFTIVNPFSAVPAFLAITPGETVLERRAAARMACIIGTCLLILTALAGEFVFRLLGITLPALQIAGGIILFSIGFEMVRAPDAPKRLNESEREAAREKEDIAVTPLAVPLLCGPGSVSTVIILESQSSSVWESGMLVVSIAVVYLACFLILSASAKGGDFLNPILLRILRRVMGLLFAVIAVQFVVNGVTKLPFVEGDVEPPLVEDAGGK
ncbi:NAAT family transporter [Pelagicoccus sp. SDUM812002]|uniref:MarC family protein n=1 Tax=Pelagicoccus sp. SDUM812002 TaxID=3041266 RepID=UPI00280CE10D|nr:NAAT family transporter [Pelagicoccus sp. SDUM812002]MDQ8188245.1 NAAT family transporter [Pelagicoccus sp. SDUM812002]